MKYISRKIIILFTIIILCFQMFSIAFATDFFEIKCTIEEIDKSKVTIDIYDLSNIDNSIISKGALDIFKYIKSNNIEPTINGNFDSNGIFKVNNLENKLWLIKSGDFVKDNIEYQAIPQLVDSSKISSFEIIETKYEFEVPDDTSITYIVKKEWIDSQKTKHNPIFVSILHNNIVYDTITLSEQNNWSYQWSDLSDEGDWKVIENMIPDGYTVTYTESNNVFKIINTSTTVFQPQTGLESILETINNRIIIIVICAIVSISTLIVGINMKKSKKE